MKITLPWAWILGKTRDREGAVGDNPVQVAPSPSVIHRPGSGAEMENTLEEMEASLISGRSIPWTSLAVVDREPLLAAIDRLRTSLPREVEAGKRIVEDEHRILAAARMESARILGEAEKKARLILEESQLKKMAEERAQEILQQAQAQARHILGQAENQTWRVYQSLEQARDLLQADLLRLRSSSGGSNESDSYPSRSQ